MSDHPLLHAGAGRFWRQHQERSASSSNMPPFARYQELNSPRSSFGGDTASVHSLDPLIPRERPFARQSFSHSLAGETSDRLTRTSSIASGSSSASGSSRYDIHSASAFSLPSAASIHSRADQGRVDRASLANKIRDEERRDKLKSHIRQLEKLEEMRVSHEQNTVPSPPERSLKSSASSSNIASTTRLDDDRQSVSSASTHRPSISDVASADFHMNKRDSSASGDTKRTSATTKSTGTTESLPAALKLPKPPDGQHYLRSRGYSGPVLHLDPNSAELDPGTTKKGEERYENDAEPEIPSAHGVELDTVKSPVEIMTMEAPWKKPPVPRKPAANARPQPQASVMRKPLAPRRQSLVDNVWELPSQGPRSPTLDVSSPRGRPHSQGVPNVSAPSIPKVVEPPKSAPDPDLFQPSKSSQMLGLIPPTLPRRAAPPPLPPANTFELSSSPSVVYRPRADSADRRRKRRSPLNLEAYNTVLHAPFPLLPADPDDEPKKEAEDPFSDEQAVEPKKDETADKHHRRLDPEQYLGRPPSPTISIEPDIDPRTGRRWVGFR